MNEEWRPVLGWEHYEVSSIGNVRRRTSGHASPAGRVIKQKPDRAGYSRVKLYRGRGGKSRPVHQLVCEAFHGPRPPGQEVRHLDGTRTNAREDNLTWGTRAQNIEDRAKHNLVCWRPKGEDHTHHKLTEEFVREARARHHAGEQVKEIWEAGAPCSYRALADAVCGNSWKHVTG